MAKKTALMVRHAHHDPEPGRRVKEKEKKAEVVERVRIRIRSYDHRILDESVKNILGTIERYQVRYVGPIPLPTEIERWTVNRSTFKHKDSREQFERRWHKRLIDILEPSPQVMEALSGLTLPVGVDIEIKT